MRIDVLGGEPMNIDNATRSALTVDGRTLSYVDFGGPGRPLLALHGHMSEGMSYADFAARLAPDWRVIAPDQRGHGDSDRAADYSRVVELGTDHFLYANDPVGFADAVRDFLASA
ncbi:alpha/beta fold hydrolase [Streptomyces sp. NPDC004069]